jgi:hypothetical protein
MKRSKEKIARRKINFQLIIKRLFLVFRPLLFSEFIMLSVFVHFKRFKNPIGAPTLSSTKHLETLISTEQYTKKFLGVGTSFVMFCGLLS